MPNRKPYPSDVSDQEWAFVAPYLALVREDAPQRNHDELREEVLNGLRWVVRTGSPWRYMPHGLCPAMGGSVPAADEAVATDERFRGDDPQFARTLAAFLRQSARSDIRATVRMPWPASLRWATLAKM